MGGVTFDEALNVPDGWIPRAYAVQSPPTFDLITIEFRKTNQADKAKGEWCSQISSATSDGMEASSYNLHDGHPDEAWDARRDLRSWLDYLREVMPMKKGEGQGAYDVMENEYIYPGVAKNGTVKPVSIP